MTMPIGEAFVVIRPVMTGFSTAVRGEVASSVAGSTAALSGMTRSVGAATTGAALGSAGMVSRVGAGISGVSTKVGSSIRNMAGQSRGMIGGIGSSLKSMAAFAAPLLAIIGLKSIFTKGIAGAREENKVLASISQTIKTTGDASHMTRGSIDKLAGSLSNQTGKVKATILGGESMLLMFKNVRNEVGKGNDIFTQTTKLSLDLSAKMGTTVPSAAKILGKALQDPLKGMSQLRRANIILTSAQQDSIKKFMAHGKVMDAQRVILGAVSSAVGGQAKAQATAADKMKVAWGNFTTEIGQKVLPIVNKIENFISTKVIPTLIKWFHQILAGQGVWGSIERAIKSFIKVVQDVIKWMQAHETLVKAVAVGLLAFWAAWKGFTIISKVIVSFQKLKAVMMANPFFAVIAIIIGLVAAFIYAYKHSETFRDIVNKVWKSISDFFIKVWRSYLKPVFDELVKVWKSTWAFLQRAWTSVGRPIFNVIVAVVKIMWKAIEVIFKVLLVIWKILWGAIKLAWNYIGKPIFFLIGVYLKVWWFLVSTIFKGLLLAWKVLWAAIQIVWDIFKPTIIVIGKIIYAIIGGVILLAIKSFQWAWAALWAAVKWAWTKIGKPVFDLIAGVVTWVWKKVMIPIFAFIGALWSGMWTVFHKVWNTVGKPIFDVVSTVIHGAWSVIQKVFGWITKAWSGLWGGMSGVFSSIWKGIQSAITTGVNLVIDIINFFIGAIDWVLNKLPGHLKIDKIKHVSSGGGGSAKTSGGGARSYYKEGGVLPGYSPGHDNILIDKYKFSGGEGILTPETTRALGGARGIDKLNRMFTKRMAGSGKTSDGQHFGIGGFIGTLAHSVGSAISAVAGMVRRGLAAVLRTALNLAEAPLKAGINALPDGVIHKFAQGGFLKIDGILRHLIDTLGGQARKAAAKAAGPIPTGDHLALIQQALKYAKVTDNPDNESAVNMIVSYESGWNPNAINLTDSNAQAGHPSQGLMQCVSLATTILTRRGWLTHDQVVVGDETIGYNPATGRSEWTTITKVVHYENAPVWRVGHRNWHADVTPNHRWWSDTEVLSTPETLTICSECGYTGSPRGVSTHRGRAHRIRNAVQKTHRGEFIRTEDFSLHHRVRLAAPTDTIGIIGLSVEDAQIIAWLQGDGHVRRAEHGHGWDGVIFQSKPEMIVKLRALFAHIEHTESVRAPRSENQMPQHVFRLRREYVTDLFKRAAVMEDGPEAFVLRLSPDQRSGWLSAMMDAEGHRMPGKKPGYSEFVRIAQVNGPMQDAIRLAVYLEGWRPTFSANSGERNGYKPAGVIGMAKPHVAPSTFHDPEVLPQQMVWCVATPLQTWTAGLDGQIFLTGNTIIGTFEAYRNKSLPDFMTDPLADLVAGINYAVSTYGSLGNVPGVKAVRGGGKYVGYSSGAWKVDSDQIAKIHKDEMILPKSTADNVRNGGGSMNEAAMVAAFTKALSGMAIRFDGDGLARLVTKHQGIYAVKGVHR